MKASDEPGEMGEVAGWTSGVADDGHQAVELSTAVAPMSQVDTSRDVYRPIPPAPDPATPESVRKKLLAGQKLTAGDYQVLAAAGAVVGPREVASNVEKVAFTHPRLSAAENARMTDEEIADWLEANYGGRFSTYVLNDRARVSPNLGAMSPRIVAAALGGSSPDEVQRLFRIPDSPEVALEKLRGTMAALGAGREGEQVSRGDAHLRGTSADAAEARSGDGKGGSDRVDPPSSDFGGRDRIDQGDGLTCGSGDPRSQAGARIVKRVAYVSLSKNWGVAG